MPFRCLILLLCLLLALPARADDAARQLQEVEAALKEKKAAAARAAKEAAGNAAAAARFQEQLQTAAREEAAQQAAMDKLDAELDELKRLTETARNNLAKTARRQSGMLGMMLRLTQLPMAAWWLNDGISLDQERRMLLLRAAAGNLGVQAEKLRNDLLAADKLQARLERKQEQLLLARSVLQEHAETLNALIAERQKNAAAQRSEQAVLQKEMVQLTSAAADLRGLLDKMARKKPEKQGKADKPGKLGETPLPPPPAQPENNSDSLLPVSGLVARGFGARDNFGITSRGLTFSARPGARVIAPLAGKAVFVGPFKGYGTIVILQHGGNYHSLLAGFGQVDVMLGQKVGAGEPIGLVGAPKTKGTPEFYFELRRDGEPVNPLGIKKRPA